MGRLVRVGPYYIPPSRPPLWGKWRPYTLSVFAIANTRDGRGV